MKNGGKKVRPSIGRRMYDVVTRIDFFTVFVHLILITAGALLALFLSNLQQKKIEQKKEIVMLEQLNQGLAGDLQNLEQFAEYHQAIVFQTRQLRQFLMNDHPWNDSMSQLFYTISSTPMVYPHSGAFESLKSTGIDLVQNPEIRLRLFTLYEEDFRSLNRMEDDYSKILSELWLPFFSNHILIDSNPQLARPINFESFRRDLQLLNFVTIFNLENNALLYSIRQNIVEATLIHRQIEFELDRIHRGKQDDVKLRTVRFTLKGFPDAKVVTIPGTFNSWITDADTMKKDKDGWYLDLPLRPNWYMYKFIVDGVWIDDPANPDKVQTEYTTYNSIMEVE
ncbi:MAG: glycogen-binding domain-containing protein [Chitinophagales bacterium]